MEEAGCPRGVHIRQVEGTAGPSKRNCGPVVASACRLGKGGAQGRGCQPLNAGSTSVTSVSSVVSAGNPEQSIPKIATSHIRQGATSQQSIQVQQCGIYAVSAWNAVERERHAVTIAAKARGGQVLVDLFEPSIEQARSRVGVEVESTGSTHPTPGS